MSHLKQLLASHGVSQTDLARILRRDKSVITNLFQGKRQLKADEAMLIARHIGVSVTDVLGIPQQGPGFMEAPLLIPFQQEPSTQNRKRSGVVRKEGKFYLEVKDGAAYSPKTYALEMADDSMNMAGIMAGDIVLSELDRPCKAGQVVVAQHYQGRGAKTVIRSYEPPFLLPHSTNAKFKPLSIEHDEVRVVSPVIKLIRNY